MAFEQQYPVTARDKEIKEILSFITRAQSCQIISVPGAGRSTVMRLLAFHEGLKEHHLGEKKKQYLFTYVNFAEMPDFAISELHKFLFLSLLSALEKQDDIQKQAYDLFTEALNLGDSLVLSQNLKKVIELLSSSGLVPLFLFDRFSEFAIQTSNRFFSDLRTLRSASGGTLSIVFSTHCPLEELLPLDQWKDFWEFFVKNHIFLKLYDSITTDFRIKLLEKEYGKTLEAKQKEKLIELTGGHGKLMKLSVQLLLNEMGRVEPVDLEQFLLSHILIQGSLLEIWQSLEKNEQNALKNNQETELLKNLGLPFPLLSGFVKQNIKDKLIPKTIRFNESDNQMYFGDDAIEELTQYEFKLLLFLIQNPGKVLDKDEVIKHVWTDEKSRQGVSDEALSQMLYRLRKKVEDEAESPKHILTVKGRGLRFIP